MPIPLGYRGHYKMEEKYVWLHIEVGYENGRHSTLEQRATPPFENLQVTTDFTTDQCRRFGEVLTPNCLSGHRSIAIDVMPAQPGCISSEVGKTLQK
ncbi:hypothetical protein TNCV_4935001 [Trichonephila clavipes]|uniref:Uncharacterized protein n=1 Tax=Trichonephila clavipes TaxID=2585209 RepID=A0A8X6SHD2_TRICX|nr:hypothetical protein TNCV_4935001 [Trichonephila clavipes]